MRAVDDLTVEFQLSEPQPTFPIMLALWVSFPVRCTWKGSRQPLRTARPEYGVDPRALVYNGPYVLADCVAGDRATIEQPELVRPHQSDAGRDHLPFHRRFRLGEQRLSHRRSR